VRDAVASLGHARSVRRRVVAGRTEAAAQKNRDSPGRKSHPAVRGRGLGGIIVRRLSCPRLLASTVLRATPSFGEHRLSGNTGFSGTRLVGQAFVMHEPPMARLPACEQLPADVVIAHAKNVREQYDATRR
jgi:hypothetical protein